MRQSREATPFLSFVLAGLDPAIHAAGYAAWTTGSGPVVTIKGFSLALFIQAALATSLKSSTIIEDKEECLLPSIRAVC
jgi:hypothetical protein